MIQKLDTRGTRVPRIRQRLLSTLSKLLGFPGDDRAFPLLIQKALFVNHTWFDLLYDTGELSVLLNTAPPRRQGTLLWWLNQIADKRPGQVAALLAEWSDLDPSRTDELIRWFNGLSQDKLDPALGALLKTVVDKAPERAFPEERHSRIVRLLPSLCHAQPSIVSEILKAFFTQYFERNPGSHPFRHNVGSEIDVSELAEIAKEAPSVFLDGTIPALIRSAEMTLPNGPTGGIHVLYQARHGGGPAKLFSLYRDSLRSLVETDPAAAERKLDKLDPALHEVILHLHLETIAANPAALGYRFVPLLDSPRLFTAGMENAEWRSFADASRSVLDSQSVPVQPIEETIFQHRPERDRAIEMAHYNREVEDSDLVYTRQQILECLSYSGHDEWCVLKTIGHALLSDRGRKRLAELDRKFSGEQVPTPRVYEATRVGSPVPDHATSKMSDDQWLAAIQKYGSRTNHHDDGNDITSAAPWRSHRIWSGPPSPTQIDLPIFFCGFLPIQALRLASTFCKAWLTPIQWIRTRCSPP